MVIPFPSPLRTPPVTIRYFIWLPDKDLFDLETTPERDKRNTTIPEKWVSISLANTNQIGTFLVTWFLPTLVFHFSRETLPPRILNPHRAVSYRSYYTLKTGWPHRIAKYASCVITYSIVHWVGESNRAIVPLTIVSLGIANPWRRWRLKRRNCWYPFLC